MSKAKELCPDLVVLHYDFQQYESVSEQVHFFVFLDLIFPSDLSNIFHNC